MDTWPPSTVSTESERHRKGKLNHTFLPYPLLQGGALTSAIPARTQDQASSRKLVCNETAVLAFPATRSPQSQPPTLSPHRRAEQSARFLRTHYPDVDVPAELIREQVGVEAQLEDSLRAFDPLVGDPVTSFHVSDGSKTPWSFMAFPMSESGCDLNFSNIEFSERTIITKPSHYPAKVFETPICQIVSSPVSCDLSKGTVVGVRTFSSTSLLSLSLPTSKQNKTSYLEIKEIGPINHSHLNGRMAVDVQIHGSLEYAALVNDQGHVFRRTLLGDTNPIKVYGGAPDSDNDDNFWRIALGNHKETCLLSSSRFVQLIDFRVAESCVQLYSVARAPDRLTSVKCDLDDGLSRLVTTKELIWVDPRQQNKPILAWKHEREYDRTLSCQDVGIGNTKFTVLSSRNNCLLSVYDVSRDESGLLQSHALPYALSCRFPSGPHIGFYVVHPYPGSGNATTASLLQLTSRGAIYQAALACVQGEDETPSPATIDISWSSAVHRLATTSRTQRPDVGKLGARAMREVDFRQAYQQLFFPLGVTEAVYPAENASAVYHTLDVMPLFWQEASSAHEHMLTLFDIALRSGEEPTHASRTDFLTQSALSSRRGFRALTQGRVPREILMKGAGWYFNLVPVLERFVPDISGEAQLIVEKLGQYDLALDDYRSGSSLRRESEAREQLAVDLVLSTDVYSAQPFAEAEATMSRATEAMTLSGETGQPSVRFGYLNPVLAMDNSKALALPQGWDTGTDPDQYAYHDPYDDQRPVAIPRTHSRKRGDRDDAQGAMTQQSAKVPPCVIAHSRVAATAVISSSQPMTRRLDGSDWAEPDGHSDSYRPVASTQVVPGPFGARLPIGRKGVASGKKRVGGF
ncbi:RNA polymerase I-specific transcription-initiation factor-domain-containing protein [Russula earlei]|uniref:RNA polymerase I-specific transcription-initiation factor-domain-containing protein n=1 Tax=Russula earlei TaxID=71964 RepID=A0ACC0U2S1_9AGAM|nr:RNA polymerase I-specific transcription-initiation factor-domain-containing protein [Russula earlei]